MGRSGCNSARCNRRNRRARNGPCQRTRIHTVATGVIDNSPAPSRLVNADALGGTEKGHKCRPELVHTVAVRANMRSILVAMMKSFSCSPLIFLVCREIVALPQPKLIFG